MKKLKIIYDKLFNQEYCKVMLNFILFNSILMMWCSYILAWFGKDKIAESLSQTIVNVVIGVVVPYFVTKTVENISKYGSRLNRSTSEFDVKFDAVDNDDKE